MEWKSGKKFDILDFYSVKTTFFGVTSKGKNVARDQSYYFASKSMAKSGLVFEIRCFENGLLFPKKCKISDFARNLSVEKFFFLELVGENEV